MPQTWTNARAQFGFKFNLMDYDSVEGRKERIGYKEKHKKTGLDVSRHDGYFQLYGNDLEANTALELHFLEHARKTLEVYYEILFWKTQMVFRAAKMINKLSGRNTSASDLFSAGESFIEGLDRKSFKHFSGLCGISGNGLAVPSAILCFIKPEKMPIVDLWVARWVNEHHQEFEGLVAFDDFNHQCTHRQEIIDANALTERANRLVVPQPIVRIKDFEAYRKWILWTRKFADVLTGYTKTKWRARDIEMAIFTAQREGLQLSIL